MPTVKVLADTWLKKELAGANLLLPSEKLFQPEGKIFKVTDFAPDRNQHYRLELASPLLANDKTTRLQTVYAYDPHIEIEGEDACQVIKLDVPYYSQIDNESLLFGHGSRQCNLTSCSMTIDYLLNGELTRKAKELGYSEPESYYGSALNDYGDTVNHDAQTKAMQEFGIESYFSYTLSGKDLIESLKAGCPIVVGLAYKSSGHMCVVTGHDPAKKEWILNDPFGIRHGASNSYDVGANGKDDRYSYAVMQQVFWDQGQEAGWGRIITSVKGKPTGLKTGL